MSQTDLPTQAHDTSQRSAVLSGVLFDEVIAPQANERRGRDATPPFPRWRDPSTSTYFVRSSVSRMSPGDFEFPGGGTAQGLVDALAALWTGEDDQGLADSVPHLRAIADALCDEVGDSDGSVDLFCYTLF